MNLKKLFAPLAGLALVATPLFAGAQTTLTASCVGVASTNSITWTASTSGGVAPVSLLWGNLSTTSPMTIAEAPGTYTMSLTATDASSSVATTTCSATVSQPTSTTTPPTGNQAQILALIAQINALKAQILQLLGSQGTTTGTTTPPSKHGLCFDITRNLKEGDDGDDVKTLQQSLAQDSSIFPEGLVTGHFGPATEKAVEKFQDKFGAGTTTGVFGPISRGLFRQFCGEIGNGKGNPHNPNSLLQQLNATTTKHGDQGDNNQGNEGNGHGNGHDD